MRRVNTLEGGVSYRALRCLFALHFGRRGSLGRGLAMESMLVLVTRRGFHKLSDHYGKTRGEQRSNNEACSEHASILSIYSTKTGLDERKRFAKR